MSITPTKCQPFRLVWALWLCAILFGYGISSFAARWVLLAGDAIRERQLEGVALTDKEWEAFETSRQNVATWFPVSTVLNDLALISLDRATSVAPPSTEGLVRAKNLQRLALQTNPADPFGWYRYAYLLLSEKDFVGAGKAWSLSLASAPYEPRLSLSRVQMAIVLGGAVPEIYRPYTANTIRSLMTTTPDVLVDAARKGRFSSVVEDALALEPEKLTVFREKLQDP